MFVPRSVSKQMHGGKQEVIRSPAVKNDTDNSANSVQLTAPNSIQLTDSSVESQEHTIQIDKVGSSPQPKTAVEDGGEQTKVTLPYTDTGEEEPIISFSKCQRWPESGEPVCVVCGRYGEYIVDQTDRDICSLECKAKHLHQLGLPLYKPTQQSRELERENKEQAGVEVLRTKDVLPQQSEEEWTYVEHGDIVSMTDHQVERIRKKYSIKVRGDSTPRPVIQFSHLCLPVKVMANLTEDGYNTPTPVQMQTIPAALYERDLLVCAGTGSGKTLSFLLPAVLNMLHNTTPQQRASNPRVLILAPTRELAMQIEGQAKDIIKGVPMMRTALIVGGVPLAQQLHRLHSGVQIVIATPARLNDIIENHSSDIELMDIDTFVVDEVDCLFQMGFEAQVHTIEEVLPRRRQNLMFSATIPQRIEKMANRMMNNPLFICIGEPSVPCDSIKHTVIWVEEKSKKKKLMALLNDHKHFRPPAVVFVNSKMGTVLLADAVNKTHGHLSAVGIHGDMAQERRSEIVKGCLDGIYSVVVATNVLGRGVDLVTVKQVIVFDMPSSITEFIHQVGRAGRLGSPGSAFSFINNDNRAIFLDLVILLERQGVQLPPQLTNSPHLKAQLDKRKRLVGEKDTGARHNESATGGGPVKKQRGHSQDDFYRDKGSLLDLIKTHSNSRRTKH